jgi:phosphopantothenoylcysteine decarboxylase / phosphopantothenate---cysteine ligase
VSRILITSGPTRQYLDPVRYLTNASSGRMGRALAAAATAAGHEVVVVSGPVDVAYPKAAEVVPVVSTEEMLATCLELFPGCQGLIAVAAPCDYRPVKVATHKLAKNGQPLKLELVETPDIVAALGTIKKDRWMVGFALETEDARLRALQKLERKKCDLIVVNGPAAIHAGRTMVEILDPKGHVLATFSGTKDDVANALFALIAERLIKARTAAPGVREKSR